MTQDPVLLDELNERELEIIPLLAEGLSNKEIADRLFLAPSTVKWYVRQLNSKLDTRKREEIVERAEELGLMSLEKSENSYFRPRQNLPRQTTPFIGRDAELDAIHSLLENPDVRLLTILAQGGMGKTRIALEATEQQANHFPDGVYFVGLQALSDITNIVPQIATATGFQFSSDGTEQKVQILDFLSDKKMLLCIDNWEHLLEGATLLNEILTNTPDVKIIATSREKLNLMGETVYILPGMQFPDWETPDDALEYDAVQLLVQTAQRIQPNWKLDADNLSDVARVCQLTGGMPLAILLAMSWLDTLSIGEIAEEIDRSIDFLSTDMRDIPKRQHSIHAIFNTTWQRLNPDEKNTLMRMSVFKGASRRDAIEAIADTNISIIQRLVSKALIQRHADATYSLHKLLQQYGEQHLNNAGQYETIQRTHAEYYAKFVKDHQLNTGLYSQKEIVEEMEVAFDNIVTAWHSLLKDQHFEQLRDMIKPLTAFQFLQQHRILTIEKLFANLVSQTDPQSSDKSERLLHLRVSSFYTHLCASLYGVYDNYMQEKRDQLALAQQLESPYDIAFGYWAAALFVQERTAEAAETAIANINRAYEIFLEINERTDIPNLLYLKATYQWHLGTDSAEATRTLEECISISKEIGDLWFTSHALSILGVFKLGGRDYDTALECYQEAERIILDSGLESTAVYLHQANYYASIGNYEKAIELRQYLMKVLKDRNIDADACDNLIELADCYSAIGWHDQATETLAESIVFNKNIETTHDYLMTQAKLAYRRGDYEIAKTIWEADLEDSPLRLQLNRLPKLAIIQIMLDEMDLAIESIRRGLDGIVSNKYHSKYADIILSVATYYFVQAQYVQAVELLVLIETHPYTSPVLGTEITLLLDKCKQKIASENFLDAVHRGQSSGIDKVFRQLIVDFGGTNS